MEKGKPKEITKKLQNLIKNQKTSIVVFKKGSVKKSSDDSSESDDGYSYNDYN